MSWRTRRTRPRRSGRIYSGAHHRDHPIKADQAANRRKQGSRSGRPPNFDRERYKQRYTVERCINKLKQFRAVATRYDCATRGRMR